MAAQFVHLSDPLAALLEASRPWLDAAAATDLDAPAPPLDPEVLAQLRMALNSDDFAALKHYAELEPALAGEYSATTIMALALAMRHLRFKEALGLLERGAYTTIPLIQLPASALVWQRSAPLRPADWRGLAYTGCANLGQPDPHGRHPHSSATPTTIPATPDIQPNRAFAGEMAVALTPLSDCQVSIMAAVKRSTAGTDAPWWLLA